MITSKDIKDAIDKADPIQREYLLSLLESAYQSNVAYWEAGSNDMERQRKEGLKNKESLDTFEKEVSKLLRERYCRYKSEDPVSWISVYLNYVEKRTNEKKRK